MHLNDAASWIIVVFGAVFALTTVGLLSVLAFALKKLTSVLENLTAKAEPVIVKASDTLESVQRVTLSVGEKADTILARGETLTENVAGKVEKTSSAVQNAVTAPLINLSSLIAGVSKGISTWSHAATGGGPKSGNDKHNDKHKVRNDDERAHI